VIGATVTQVAYLLSKEFLALVLVAIVIAFPLVWLGMNKWLNEFAYRVPIRYDVFVLTAVVAMAVTLFTISFQSIRAATANPADALRSE
jgi:putative ABC transport system permease protein